jgi:cell division protease FtsH
LKRSFNPWILVIVIILAIIIFSQLSSGGSSKNVPYSTFKDLLQQGKVASVVIQGDSIEGQLKAQQQVKISGQVEAIKSFKATAPNSNVPDTNLTQEMSKQGVTYQYRNPPAWIGIVVSILPFLLIGGLIWFFLMRAQGGPSQVMQFGQSRAKSYGRENRVKTSFNDVAGQKEAKEELIEVVDFLKSPQKYLRIGAEIPKGVLLVGPPGTGKTLLARAVAGEANVPFFSVSASEFMEMFVGVGASRVRHLFEESRKASPSIIFIDELDSIGRRRGAGIGGGHDEREQTLNQILSEMDGFEKDTSVIILAATNRPDILDPALLRPGRFDRQVTIGLPTQREREEILRVHVRNKPIAGDVDLERLAGATPMFSGADLENLTNEAALIAARTGKQLISWLDFNEALDRIVLGLRRSSLVPTDEERKILAHHESGHAITFAAQPDLGHVRKVTIMPRGAAGGFMAPLSKEEMFLSIKRFKQRLVVAFAGRVAEKKLTGTISSGAANDLKQATDTAKQMVFDMGMGGQEFVAWGSDQGPVFLGGEISRRKDFSEETARELEEEVSNILKTSYQACEKLVEENWVAIEGLAQALLKYETIDGSLVHKALEVSQEGKPAEEITAMIIAETDKSERALEEASRRAAAEAEAQRRRAAEAGRNQPPIDPRPASEGSSN